MKNEKKSTNVVAIQKEEVGQKTMVETLISQAINKGVPIETLERLLKMRTQLKEENAREEFNRAMASFQENCPVIIKNKKVLDKQGALRYSFASIESIINQTKEIISKYGLSYRFKNTVTDKIMTVECIVTHSSGHSETSPFTVNLGTEQYMTDVQKSGARSTFAKRYAFCDAFGIMTGDEDTDTKEDMTEPKEKFVNYIDKLKYELNKGGAKNLEEALELYGKITGYLITALPAKQEDAKRLFEALLSSPTYQQ